MGRAFDCRHGRGFSGWSVRPNAFAGGGDCYPLFTAADALMVERALEMDWARVETYVSMWLRRVQVPTRAAKWPSLIGDRCRGS